MANEIPIGGLQLEFTDSGSGKVIEDITKLAEALIKIRDSAKGGNLTSKSKQINALVESIDKIKADSIKNLSDLADALGEVGSIKITSAISKQVSAVSDAVDNIDVAKLNKIKESVSGMSSGGTATITVDTQEAQKEVNGFTEGLKQNQVEIDVTTDKIAEGFDKVKDSSTGLTNNSVENLGEEFAQTKAESDSLAQSVVATKEKTRAFTSILGNIKGNGLANIKSAFTTMLAPIRQGATAVKNFEGRLRKIASSSIANGLKEIRNRFIKLGSALLGAHSFAGKLLKSFVRIAFYRSIRFTLSSLVKGFKEGATNLYMWSDAFDRTREFANSMDMIATSILYVKNSLGALVAPIINAVAPAIDYLADKFVGLLNIVNEFISALTGASTFTVAKKIGTQFQDIADGAGQASKAIHSFTIGIDELNIIEDTGGAGGGYGGAGKVAEDWFEKQQVSNEMKNFADKVKGIAEDVRGYIDYMASGEGWNDIKTKINEVTTDIGFWNFGLLGVIKNWETLTDTWGTKVLDPIGEWGADGIEGWSMAWDDLTGSVKGAWEAFKEDPLGYTIKHLMECSKWLSPMPAIFESFQNIKKWLEDPITQLEKFDKVVTGMISPIALQGGLKAIENMFKNLDSMSKDPLSRFEKLGELIMKISAYATPLPATFAGWKLELEEIKKKVKKIKEFFEAIGKTIKNLATGNISSLWSDAFGGSTDSATQSGRNATDAFLQGAVESISSHAGIIGLAIKNAYTNASKEATIASRGQFYSSGATLMDYTKQGFNSKQGALRQTVSDIAYYSAKEFTSANNMANFKSGGQYLVSGIISGLDSKKGELYDSLNKVATDAYKAFKKGAKIGSPSKLFAEGGKFIVEGLNKGIVDNEDSTTKVVDNWIKVFSNIAPNVDTSNIALPDLGAMATSVQGSINANSNITTQAMTGEITEFFTETLMPVINQISTDAKRQADKSENVILDGRKLTDSINRQNRNNGFSFT